MLSRIVKPAWAVMSAPTICPPANAIAPTGTSPSASARLASAIARFDKLLVLIRDHI